MIVKLRELAEKTLFSTRLIATYIRDMVHHTEGAMVTVDAVKNKMGQMAENMRRLENDTERIIAMAKKASQNLAEAEISSEKFLASMEKSKEALFVARDVTRELEAQVDKVSAIIQLVSMLTDQANILAQKAVKEAKSFCTPDSDFSSLAEEIQTKATDAADATKDISELFQSLRAQAQQANDALEDHRMVILNGISVAKMSYESLTSIISDLQKIAALTRGVLTNSHELVEGAQSISRDVEDQNLLVQRFSEAAGTLEQVVRELQETLNMLKV